MEQLQKVRTLEVFSEKSGESFAFSTVLRMREQHLDLARYDSEICDALARVALNAATDQIAQSFGTLYVLKRIEIQRLMQDFMKDSLDGAPTNKPDTGQNLK
jgi:glycine cleavage system pyridoxal-binding protein P